MTATVAVPGNGTRPHPDAITQEPLWSADLLRDYLAAYPVRDASDVLDVEQALDYVGIALSRIPTAPARALAGMVCERHLIQAGLYAGTAHELIKSTLREGNAPRLVAVEPKLPRSIDDLLGDTSLDGSPQWIVDGYFARGEVGLLAAAPKAGKTTLLAHLAACVAGGFGFLGRKVTSVPVLWLDLEQHERQTKRLFSDLGVQGLPLYTVTSQAVGFDIASFAKEHGIGLIVIDSLSKYWDVSDENDAALVTRAMTPIRQLAEDTDAAVVLIHHNRKSGGDDGVDIRGSGAIHAIVDVAISMKRDNVHDARRHLEATSRHTETPRKLVVELSEDGIYRALGSASEVKGRENTEAVLAVLSDEPLTVAELSEACELGTGATRRTVEQMVAQGTAERSGTGKRNDPLRYSKKGLVSCLP